jgi:hypothetical protein
MAEDNNRQGTTGPTYEEYLRATTLRGHVPGDCKGIRHLDRAGGPDPKVCGDRPPKKPTRGFFRRAYRIAEVRLHIDGIVEALNSDEERLAEYCGPLTEVALRIMVDAAPTVIFWIERKKMGRPLTEAPQSADAEEWDSDFWQMTRGQFWQRAHSRWALIKARELKKGAPSDGIHRADVGRDFQLPRARAG